MTIDTTNAPRSRFAALGGSQFLVAQVFAIASTILGVYLAGYVGFQRTLEYDRFQTARQQVSLYTALKAELEDNVTRLDVLSERMQAANEEGQPVWQAWPQLRLYVWHAAAESPALFQGPPEMVTGLQGFYADLDLFLNDARLADAFDSLTSSNAYQRNQAKERFDGIIGERADALIAILDGAIAQPAALVEAYREPDA